MLDIPPQIYGLRWIRVLFAREFTLPNTFKVWDAIFADSSTLRLTDYIFVAMLCFYRDKCEWGGRPPVGFLAALSGPLHVPLLIKHPVLTAALGVLRALPGCTRRSFE